MSASKTRKQAWCGAAVGFGVLVGMCGGKPARADSVGVLVHRYSFNDGTANDSVGTANGTLSGGATISGGAVVLNGSFGNGVALPLASTSGIDGSFTIEDWFANSGLSPGNTTQFAFGSSTSYLLLEPFIQVGMFGAGSEVLYTGGGLSGSFINGSAMVAVTYDAAAKTITYYINGAAQSQQTGVTFDLGQVATSGSDGIGGFDAAHDGSTPGSTDEFRIYTGALSSVEIAADRTGGPNIVLDHGAVGNATPLPASMWAGMVTLVAVGICGRVVRRRGMAV